MRPVLVNLDRADGVYFLLRPSTGLVKIGCTGSLYRRIKELEEETGELLIFLGCVDGGRKEERALHLRFDAVRVEGEWFSPVPELLSFVVKAQATYRYPRPTVKRTKPSRPPVRRAPAPVEAAS